MPARSSHSQNPKPQPGTQQAAPASAEKDLERGPWGWGLRPGDPLQKAIWPLVPLILLHQDLLVSKMQNKDIGPNLLD